MVKIGEIKVSVQEFGLKSCFFEDTNLDQRTLAGSGRPRPFGTPKFLGVVIFETILKKECGISVKMSYWHAFFLPSGHGKWAKPFFSRITANHSNAKNFKRYPGMPYES